MRTATLYREPSGDGVQWTRADFLPDFGMNSIQFHAWLPNLGDVEMLASPPLEAIADLLHTKDDPFAWRTFQFGGAWLLPFANRVWGERIGGDIHIPFKETTLRPPEYLDGGGYAHHGLLLGTGFTNVDVSENRDAQTLTAEAEPGDFDVRWTSQCKVFFRATLSAAAIDLEMRVTNTGELVLPVAIGWHPYFRILSGERAQARLSIPARAQVDFPDYATMRPSGRLVPLS